MFDSASEKATPPPTESQERLLSQEPKSPAGPHLAATRNAKTNNLSNTEDVSPFDLDGHAGPSSMTANRAHHESKTQESEHMDDLTGKEGATHWDTYWLDEDSWSPADGPMKFIRVRREDRQAKGLLLTAAVYQRVQAFHGSRQHLRVLVSELAVNTTKMRNLVEAKSELEDQAYRKIPGAFVDENDYAARERRHLLMSGIESKLRSCRHALEIVEAERLTAEAELEAVQEQLLDDLERAWREHRPPTGSVPEVGNRGQSSAWWSRGQIPDALSFTSIYGSKSTRHTELTAWESD